MAELVKCWTFWKNEKEKRMFLVVDTDSAEVVVMEIKEYQQTEQRIFKHIPFTDWLYLTEEKNLLVQFTPR